MRMVYYFHIVVHRQAAFPEFDIDDAHLGCIADQLKAATEGRHPWYNKKRFSQVNGSSGFDFLGLGFRASCFDSDLLGIFHRIFERHLDSEQAVLVDRFGFVRFHRPS